MQNGSRTNLAINAGKPCLLPREGGKTWLPYVRRKLTDYCPEVLRRLFASDVFSGSDIQMARKSWVDPNTNEPLIDDYAKKMANFMQAFSDGVITDQEISDQESRLVDLMQEVESQLDDRTHAAVTRLMCELTAFNIMQFVYEMQMSRATTFRG
ncbi:MAG: hypothetical protein O2856_04265 [Planctomycetota bacterium]|nr:hypothetical protein [Planctomycetota bacterium]